MKRAAGLFLLLAWVPACVTTMPEPTSSTSIPTGANGTWTVPGQGTAEVSQWPRMPPAPPVDEPRPPRPDPLPPSGELQWRPPMGVRVPPESIPAPTDPAATSTPAPPPLTSTRADFQESLVPPVTTPVVDRTAAKPPAPLNLEALTSTVLLPTSAVSDTPRSGTYPHTEEIVVSPSSASKDEPAHADKSLPATEGDAANRPAHPIGVPIVRLVNSKRITVNFEVKDVGRSGVAAVDLWYTRDCKTWHKHEGPPQGSNYVFQVPDEGMYGFTLVAHSGVGIAKDPPVSGEMPQLWVVVDLTKPKVQMLNVTPAPTGKERSLTIRWKASDPNLGRHPITLSYAEKDAGPWSPIANNLENTGSYVWTPPPTAPAKVILRVEATDLAGNIGQATYNQGILLDYSKPRVEIVDAEPEKTEQ
jgi:hypothetical protein